MFILFTQAPIAILIVLPGLLRAIPLKVQVVVLFVLISTRSRRLYLSMGLSMCRHLLLDELIMKLQFHMLVPSLLWS
mgnify:CR=1 FL=1